MITLTHNLIDIAELSANIENSEVEYLGEFETVHINPDDIFGYEELIFEDQGLSCVYVQVSLNMEDDEEQVEIVNLNTTLDEFETELISLGYELTNHGQEAEIIDFQDFKERKAA